MYGNLVSSRVKNKPFSLSHQSKVSGSICSIINIRAYPTLAVWQCVIICRTFSWIFPLNWGFPAMCGRIAAKLSTVVLIKVLLQGNVGCIVDSELLPYRHSSLPQYFEEPRYTARYILALFYSSSPRVLLSGMIKNLIEVSICNAFITTSKLCYFQEK